MSLKDLCFSAKGITSAKKATSAPAPVLMGYGYLNGFFSPQVKFSAVCNSASLVSKVSQGISEESQDTFISGVLHRQASLSLACQ